jgi:hypothetical protein
MASICAALVCGAAQAQSADGSDERRSINRPRFELDTLPRWTPRPTLTSPWDVSRVSALPPSVPLAGSGATYGDGLRARWWWGRGKLALGAGADWSAEAPTTPYAPGAAPLRPRFALEFRARSASKDLREGLLRVQMSGDAALHLRPRSGGLQVSYRERF